MTDETISDKLSRAEFWQRIALASFTLWSIVLPLLIWVVTSSFAHGEKFNTEIATDLALIRKNFEIYVLQQEKRMIIVEERQNRVLKLLEDYDPRRVSKVLEDLDERIDTLDNKHTLGKRK